MKVLLETTTAEIVEKKSRFIANVFYVENENEAITRLNEMRKKYYDAKHNCYAYILGKNGESMKSSDDGEPQGTAGHPMLDILKGEDLTNCIAIVTRYFGGTLLGTGGLVRAYSESLKDAVKNAKFSNIYDGFEVDFSVNYDDFGKVENVVQNINQDANDNSFSPIISLDKSFTENVTLKYLIDKSEFNKFKQNINNLTKGKVILEDNDNKTYYIKDKKIVYINV